MLGRLAAASLVRRIAQTAPGQLLTPACVAKPAFDSASGAVPGSWWAWMQQISRGKSNAATAAGLKVYNPTSPAMRGRVITLREGLWKGKPFKPLTFGKRSTGGRNNTGTVTAWHRGGGHKRLLRFVDFGGVRAGQQGVVQRIEYDPNRSARIALVKYGEGERKGSFQYMLAPQKVAAGHVMHSGASAPIAIGSTLPLSAMPAGTQIHNVEMNPGKGGQMVRSAGTAATLVSKGADGYALVKLPSGEQRAVLLRCIATIGAVSNPAHKNIKIGRAGSKRWMGRRPVVRGVAMNCVDHPHGGGRGKSKGRISQTPWGIPTKGHRTRKTTRTDQYIRLSRHKQRRGR